MPVVTVFVFLGCACIQKVKIPFISFQTYCRLKYTVTGKDKAILGHELGALFAQKNSSLQLAVFLFLLLFSVLGQTSETVLLIFQRLLPIMRVTSTNLILLDSIKSVCVSYSLNCYSPRMLPMTCPVL